MESGEILSNNINLPEVTEFLRTLIPQKQGEFYEFEKKCREELFPIAKPETAKLLEFFCALIKPEKILEIGCAVGFSAILMLRASENLKELITIDRYPYMCEIAKKNFEIFDKNKKIHLLEGQANEILPTLQGEFDIVFLDAAKGQYPEFLPHCIRLLRKGGVLIADNILFDGMIVNETLAKRRNRTIVRRVRAFLKEISEREDLKTSVLPLGDGVSVSVKLSDDNLT